MKRFLFITVVVVVMLGLFFSGCAKPAPAPGPAPGPAPAPPAAPEEIRVGDVAALTGMYAAFGVGGTFGLKAAADDMNKQGGIYVKQYDRKLPIRIITVDTESDPIKTSTLAESLVVSDRINVFVSPLEPPPTRSGVSIVAEKYRIPNVAGTGPLESWEALRESVTPPWQYTWITGYSISTPCSIGDFRYGEKGYELLQLYLDFMDRFADKTNRKVGVFAADDSDGRGDYPRYHEILQKNGYETIGKKDNMGIFPLETTDYTPMIKKWQDFGAQILIGNCPAPHFGTMLRQCRTLGFEPKLIIAPRAALFYDDVNAWGGDLPNGIVTEWWWDPSSKGFHGIGDTTPETLFKRWTEETNQPLNQMIGLGYLAAQVTFDAIERAGTLDGDAVNKALAETDLMTIGCRVAFDKEWQASRWPLYLCQWQETNEPSKWIAKVVYSDHEFIPATAEPLFPIP